MPTPPRSGVELSEAGGIATVEAMAPLVHASHVGRLNELMPIPAARLKKSAVGQVGSHIG